MSEKNNKTCKYCNNIYSRADSMRRHLETCQAKIDHDEKEHNEQIVIKSLVKKIQQKKS